MRQWIALGCIVAATSANAADVGLGVSFESNDSAIYVPIEFEGKWRLEPSLRYYKEKSDYGVGTAESETFELGVGAFALKPLGESVQLYFGARASYLDGESEFNLPGQQDTSSFDGYRIAPTLGFEYLFNKHLSLGGEAEWFYQDIDGASRVTDQEAYESTGTNTRVMLRVRF